MNLMKENFSLWLRKYPIIVKAQLDANFHKKNILKRKLKDYSVIVVVLKNEATCTTDT